MIDDDRLYDKHKRRLIWLKEKATADFWVGEWTAAGINKNIYRPSSYVSSLTAKYLHPSHKPIVEAGCGRANHVYALQQQGYHVIGVDFAQETIEEVNKLMPELDIRFGDVLDLPFEDGSCSGYWSLGLIEHFWDGFDPLVEEAYRILEPGGIAFITFPYMSPLRQLKATLSRYENSASEISAEPENFYQFSLNKNHVQRQIEKAGFKCIGSKGLDGLKGLKSEIKSIARPLQKLYDYRGNSLPIRGFRYLLSEALTSFSAHSVLLVFKKMS